ncbi:MAG: hypothetical protein Q8O14_14740 [bacterium]|nr:hypothetical protein [bacterium]
MKPTYVMTITVGGPVTRADLENAIAKLASRWGDTSIIEATIHKARARRARPATEGAEHV